MKRGSTSLSAVRYLVAILALALGALGMVAGEADDSPGLQLVGLCFIVAAVVLAIRSSRRNG